MARALVRSAPSRFRSQPTDAFRVDRTKTERKQIVSMRLIKIIQERGFSSDVEAWAQAETKRALSSDSTLKVEITAVAQDVIPVTGQLSWPSIPCCTPPMDKVWTEFFWQGGHFGVLIDRARRTANEGFELNVKCFESENGHWVDFIGYKKSILLRQNGTIENCDKEILCKQRTSAVSQYKPDSLCSALIYIALHGISRMHCKNIKLSPVGQPKQSGWKPDELPGKFLREIVITSVPQTRSTGRSIFRSERMRREHWVRGHYADYRKHGLFGKIKGLFWIPEHKAGSAALGTTEHQYRIAS